MGQGMANPTSCFKEKSLPLSNPLPHAYSYNKYLSQREKTEFNLYLNPSKYEKAAKSDNKTAVISDVSLLYIRKKRS